MSVLAAAGPVRLTQRLAGRDADPLQEALQGVLLVLIQAADGGGERGLDREQLYTRGYWKLGVADHPDHDTGED